MKIIVPAVMAVLFVAAMLGYTWAGFILIGAVLSAAAYVAWARIKQAM